MRGAKYMQPQPNDRSINIPITFDYKGGRNENKRNKWILAGIIFALSVVFIIGTLMNDNLGTIRRLLIVCLIFYVSLLFLRFFVFKELYYSDIYETLKEMNFTPSVTTIWKIFDIDYTYPYIVYFKNGTKGVFVRMEKDAITGKGENSCFNHYEALSEAYNKAHSAKMDIRHIDYMDNVGNDSRLQALYDNLKDVENPDMEEMLIDIYSNLQKEMSLNYASFDIYLFLTRDRTENFIYNVQQVCGEMLGGNFITYRFLNRTDIRSVCMALFNLHDFSVTDSCEEVLTGEKHGGIVPIRVIRADGTVEELNETQEAKRIRLAEQARKERELKEAKKDKNKKKKNKGKEENKASDEDLNLFE